ncbi:hypothetical protein Tco_0308801 [Tanacetum coccineum]
MEESNSYLGHCMLAAGRYRLAAGSLQAVVGSLMAAAGSLQAAASCRELWVVTYVVYPFPFGAEVTVAHKETNNLGGVWDRLEGGDQLGYTMELRLITSVMKIHDGLEFQSYRVSCCFASFLTASLGFETLGLKFMIVSKKIARNSRGSSMVTEKGMIVD